MIEDFVKKVSDGRVSVLRAGSEKELPNGFFHAPATITLIKREFAESLPLGYSIVDAGGFGEELDIASLLACQGVTPNDIGSIFITHNHPDHVGAIGHFKHTEVFMPDSYFTVYSPNKFRLMQREGFFDKPGNEFANVGQGIHMVSTPGHSGWDASYLYGWKCPTIAIVGDLFWSQEDWEHNSEYLGLCVNPEMQKRSRDYVRKELKPEIIIPGHGPAFKPKY